ncbi:MAG TPA: CBS domain-containing protein [Yinghuangia sp.]|uniref:CBS domain-containing protein n=1 Tax=Yinghuangia sp. YIM S10712 TaxID=3436930 RepID=UPI002CC5C5F0|nr:CBS domain-containing protein [Yinghuangia sp.]
MTNTTRAALHMGPGSARPPDVGDVMHAPVVAVDATDTLWTAMDVMLTRGLRHLVVTRDGVALGILSDRDLAAVWAMDPIGLKNRRAADVLVTGEPFVPADTDVITAATRMRGLGGDALVVVDTDGAPLGVVTDHDLLGVLAALLRPAR